MSTTATTTPAPTSSTLAWFPVRFDQHNVHSVHPHCRVAFEAVETEGGFEVVERFDDGCSFVVARFAEAAKAVARATEEAGWS